MRTKYSFYVAATILLMAASCKKTNVIQSGSIQGTWSFENEQVHTQVTIDYISSGVDYKTVTVSNYTTTNNAGILNITSDIMNVTGLSYSINDTAIGYNYQNGTFIDSVVQTNADIVLPTNSNSAYVLVGTDSIYFPSGGFNAPSGFQATSASGARINISGDTVLTVTTTFVKDSSIFLYGMPATANYQATLISKFN